MASNRAGKSTAIDCDEVVANRGVRFFVCEAQRILDEALALLANLHEERIHLNTVDGPADIGGSPTELHYTNAYVGSLREELSRQRVELYLARSEVLSFRGLFANLLREAGSWREYADQLELDFNRRGEELNDNARELRVACAELSMMAV